MSSFFFHLPFFFFFFGLHGLSWTVSCDIRAAAARTYVGGELHIIDYWNPATT